VRRKDRVGLHDVATPLSVDTCFACPYLQCARGIPLRMSSANVVAPSSVRPTTLPVCLVLSWVMNRQRRPCCIYGGAFRQGSASAWTDFAGRLAKRTNARVVVPDYRLAPEYPFPAALHDCAAVLVALCGKGRPIILSGDSAGGGLALSLAAICASPTRLAGLALISPWTDLNVTADSFADCAATDVLFSRDAAHEAAELYLQGIGADDPLASPHFADLTTLPPVLLMASTIEVLRDDATRLVERLARANRRVDALFETDVPHDWPFVLPDHPATARALARYATFVAEVTSTTEGV